MLGVQERPVIVKPKEQPKVLRLPRALSIRREDFNRDLIGKVIVVFVSLGPILVPILWLSGVPIFQGIASFGWDFGRAICSYTVKSLQIGGLNMMVCTRCFGVATGLLAMGLLYHYSPWVRPRLPRKRLYVGVMIGLLFVPWLIDSGLERLELWRTDHWLMFPTGFMGGMALVLAPLLFSPLEEPEEDF